ncbi:MAG TPA: lipid II flippase MurJ, partial [Mycobacteriales bacterium]|nr:lipid II flippase MurJ [Mycobacteriales bacterium]
FVGPALAPLLSSLVVIAAYLWYWLDPGQAGDIDALGSRAEAILSVGTTLGVVALSLSLLLPLHRAGVPIRPTWRFPAGVARRAGRLAAAGVAVLVAQQASVAVALRLANDGTSAGAVVVFTLAQTVFLLPWATIAVPLATSAFPRLSSTAEAGDEAGFARTTGRVSQAVLAASATAAGVLFAAATPIARVLVQGVGQARDIDALSAAVAAFAPGLIGYGLVALWSRALYARHDARTPAYAMVTGWVAVIVADLILTAALPVRDRIPALAAGNSIGMTVAAGLLAIGLVRRSGAAGVLGPARLAVVAVLGAAGGATLGRIVAGTLTGGGAAVAVLQGILIGAVAAVVAAGIILGLGGGSAQRLLRGRANG